MPGITDVRELFIDELQDILYVERTLTKVLPELAREATDADLTRGFEEHLEQTRGHVQSVEQVFAALGEKPKAKPCPGIEGLKEEHDEFMQEDPSPEICDIFLTGAASRTEHYEIAAYTSLVGLAKALGETEAAGLLAENLRQEKETLKRVEMIGTRLGKASVKAAAEKSA